MREAFLGQGRTPQQCEDVPLKIQPLLHPLVLTSESDASAIQFFNLENEISLTFGFYFFIFSIFIVSKHFQQRVYYQAICK